MAIASAHGPIQLCCSSQRSSGIRGEVLDAVEVGVLVLGRQDPAHVAPPEPVPGRVHVAVEVGVAVVDPVVAGPPQRALLHRGGPPKAIRNWATRPIL